MKKLITICLSAFFTLVSVDASEALLETHFVDEGKPVSVLYEGSPWEEKNGYLVASGINRIVYGGESLGRGDVAVRVRLSIMGLKGSAASFVIDNNHIGFSAANGRMFLQGGMFGGLKYIEPTSQYITDGVPFILDVSRENNILTVKIDGKIIYQSMDLRRTQSLGAVGLRPWRSTMSVYDFSASGQRAPGRVLENRLPGPIRAMKTPRIDISDDTARQSIVAQGTKTEYKGHPDTVTLEDNQTIFVVYPKGHGGPGAVMHKSDDAGRTWSKPLEVPSSWDDSTNCPTIYRMTDPEGTERLIVFEGVHNMRQAYSEDDGVTWTEMQPNGLRTIMPFTSIIPISDDRYLGAWNHEGGVWVSTSNDGGLTWGEGRKIATASETFPHSHPCEPMLIRSPDGTEIACLMRENRRQYNSLVTFSKDEGKTWSEMQEVSRELTGDRHAGGYLSDGRLFIAMRDMAPGSEDFGHFVGWLGQYDDLRSGDAGDARFKLLHNYSGTDCGYPGVEILPDGKVVATTYADINPGPELQSVVSVHLEPIVLYNMSIAEENNPDKTK